MRKLYRTLAAALAVLALSIPTASADDWQVFGNRLFGPAEKGSGQMETETRDLPTFTEIESDISIELEITVGQPQKVTVTIDDNLLDNIKTTVRGGKLSIDSKGSFSTRNSCVVKISMERLEVVECNGSGEIVITNLKGDEFTAEIAGSANIEASGEIERLFLEVSGSGEIDASDLIAQDIEVEISGSGDAVVNPIRSLDGEISGSGTIRYVNEPERINTDVTGSGSIRRSKR